MIYQNGMTHNLLLLKRLTSNPTVNLIVIDNFYDNPTEVRNFALKLDYEAHPHHPGFRTKKQYITDHYDKFKEYFKSFGAIDVIETTESSGTFQYNTANDYSWIHTDSPVENYEAWAGIVYLSPESPYSAGTGFYKFRDGTILRDESLLLDNVTTIKTYGRNFNTNDWTLVSNVGNIFNRLILFRSDQYHKSMNYFGTDINDGRLIQLFFFALIYEQT